MLLHCDSHCRARRGPGDSQLHQEGYCSPGLGEQDMPPAPICVLEGKERDRVSMKKSNATRCVSGKPGPCYFHEKVHN